MTEKAGELGIGVKVDFSGLQKQLKKVGATVSKTSSRTGSLLKKSMGGLVTVATSITSRIGRIFTNAFNKIARTVKRAMLVAGLAVSSFLVISTKMAIDVEEMQSLFDKSFGEMSKSVQDWSDIYSKSIRTNKFETRGMLTTMFNIGRAMKLTDEAASDTAKELVSMANDLKSAFNLKGDVAFDKIRSGIIGMSKPLQDLGIDLRVAAVEEFALSKGMKKVNGDFTQQQKIMARTGLLKQTLKSIDVIGDMEDTIDSTQNRLRALTDGFKEFSINMGNLIKKSTTFKNLLSLVERAVAKLQIIISKNLVKSLASLDKHFENRDNIIAWQRGLLFIAETAIKVKNAIASVINKTIKWLSLAENQKKLIDIWEDIKNISSKVVESIGQIGLAIKAFALGTEEELSATGLTFLRLMDTMWAIGKVARAIGAVFNWVNETLFSLSDRLGKTIGSFIRAIMVVGEFIVISQLLRGKLTLIKTLFSAIGGTVLYFAEMLGLASATAVSMGSTTLGVLATVAFAAGWFFGKLLDWGGHFSDLVAGIIIQITKLINIIPGVNIGGIGTFGNDKSNYKNNMSQENKDKAADVQKRGDAARASITLGTAPSISRSSVSGTSGSNNSDVVAAINRLGDKIDRQPQEDFRLNNIDTGVNKLATSVL